MASTLFDELDDDLQVRLRKRAAASGRSVEAEARSILTDALAGTVEGADTGLASSIRAKFAPFGLFELDLPPRQKEREPPRFDD